MTKFAKLFDVADTQVLFRVTTGDDGEPVLQVTTQFDGMDICANISFKHADEDVAWEKADAALNAVNQESADKFHAQMTQTLSGNSAERST